MWLLALLIFSAFYAAAQTPATGQAVTADPNYRIGVGDVLSVLVPKNQILSTDTVRVGNDGTIRLPMLDGNIGAKCLTEAELSEEVTKRYKKYLLNPQVYVTVREFNSNPVAVVGAVNAPGRFQLQRPVRLLALLTYVNGASANAGRDVRIIRGQNSQSCLSGQTGGEPEADEQIITLPLAAVMTGGETANPFVYPEDVIQVSEAEQAYIIGSVARAIPITLKEPVTLSKAIAMAGGVSAGAQINKVKIMRQEAGSLNKTELIVNLGDINQRKAEDVLLQPNDIVEVPGPSGKKKLLRDIFRTMVPAVTRTIPILPIL
jgi:polysaccharide export outer membrane protein